MKPKAVSQFKFKGYQNLEYRPSFPKKPSFYGNVRPNIRKVQISYIYPKMVRGVELTVRLRLGFNFSINTLSKIFKLPLGAEVRISKLLVFISCPVSRKCLNTLLLVFFNSCPVRDDRP